MSTPDLTTPGAVAAFLRRYQDWRRWDGDMDEKGPAMPSPRDISKALDAAIGMLDRLDAAEKDNALKEKLIDRLALELNSASHERDALRAEMEKTLRCATTMCDTISNHCMAMQAAVLDGKLQSPAHGLQWIVNTLDGPGLLPDLEEAKALGGAQAWFDREVEKYAAIIFAHRGAAGTQAADK